MKKVIYVCLAATLVTSVTGCGCCRRFRDWVCRGSRCSTPAPVLAAPPQAVAPPVAQPVAVAPMAFDPGCGYAAADPGCGYSGSTIVGYPGPVTYDSGWQPGCQSCSGGLTLPPTLPDGSFLTSPPTTLPGPAPVTTP